MTDNKQEYTTTDKNTILLLLVAGVAVLKSYKDEHQKTIFVFDRSLSEEWINKYQRNESLKFEFAEYIKALGFFNSIVHSR